MLSEEIIEKIGERLSNRIESLNTRVLEEIGKNIKKIGALSYIDALKLSQIIKYGGSYEKITQEIAKMTNLTVQDIEEIFKEVAKKDLNFAKQFYDYRGIDFVPYEENMVLQKQIQAISRITMGEFLTNTTALGYGLQDMYGNVTYKGIKEAYSELIDKAVISIAQGKETFEQSMYKQLKTLGGGGLRVIYPTTYVDKNGITKHYTRRLDSVVRTQIEEGLRTLHNATQEIYGNEFGSNGVEVSHHANAAPDHIDSVDGKQFALIDNIQNQIAIGTEKEIKYEDIRGNQVKIKGKWYDDFNAINNSLARKVSTLNCQHWIWNIIVGVTKPEYTQEQLDEAKLENNWGFEYEGKHYTLYEGTQLQRQIETEIRKQKDTQILAKASDNKQLIAESQQKITQLTHKYKELCDKSGLKSRLDRARVSGYKRVAKNKLK